MREGGGGCERGWNEGCEDVRGGGMRGVRGCVRESVYERTCERV